MSNNLERNLQESIILQNTFISILPKMIRDKDKSVYKFMREYTRENVLATTEAVLQEVKVNLLKEVFILTNQMWAENSTIFNEGLIKQRSVYNVIRSQLAKDDKPLPFNNKQLYKKIRESIVHNSVNNPNFVYNLENFELNLGKVNGEDYIINLDIHQMLELIGVLFSNFQETGEKIRVTGEPGILTTRQDIKNKIKTIESNGVLVDLDDNQVERMYHYFNFVQKDCDYILTEKVLKGAMAKPNNAQRLFLEKLIALSQIVDMKPNTSWGDLRNKFDELSVPVNVMATYSSVVSNLLFTMASNQTNSELADMLDGCVDSMDENKVRHFRNALCHGRYFYNFDNTYYFYDGRKDLTCELKLTVVDINKILDKVAKGKYHVTALK